MTAAPKRSDHCTHPDQEWCDCDWCRLNHHWIEYERHYADEGGES